MSSIKEVVEKTIRQETVVRRICDFCKKGVNPHNYYSITTSHSDWGNDSIESYQDFDACSPKCAIEFATKYIEGAFDAFNTKTIEIEHCRSLKTWERK